VAEIRVALVTLPWRGETLQRLKEELAPAEVICVHRLNAPQLAAALRRADVAFLAGDMDERFLAAPNIRWVHCGHSGVDRSARPAVFERGLLVTSSAGRSAPALAEHAMFFMLALSFRFGRFYEAQQSARWGVGGQHELRALHGQTLGIVGLGHTGSELARRAKAFGMTVLAYRRRPLTDAAVDRLFSADRGDALDALLMASDYVVLAVPLTDRTYHLIGARELSLMRPGSHLVNIGRGGVVDEAALLVALETGHLAGAAIDVAEQEPLPRDSRLWHAPNLLITPHVTPRGADRDERALEILLENIRHYRADEPMRNRLMPEDQLSRRRLGTSASQGRGSSLAGLPQFTRRLLHWLRTR